MSRGDTPGEGPWWHVYTAEWCGCILTVSCQADTLISHPGLFASETGHQYRHLWCLGLCVPYVCDKVQKTTVVNLQSLQWVFLLLPHHTVLLLKLLQLGRRHLQQRPTPADDNTRQKSLQTPRQMNKHTQTTTLNGTQYACNNTFLVKKKHKHLSPSSRRLFATTLSQRPRTCTFSEAVHESTWVLPQSQWQAGHDESTMQTTD